MSYFAELNENNVVLRVIVSDQTFIDTGIVGDPKKWVETFLDGSQRKNYASIGYKYHQDIDAFSVPQPFPSWTFETDTATYSPPTDQPQDVASLWDEKIQMWVILSSANDPKILLVENDNSSVERVNI